MVFIICHAQWESTSGLRDSVAVCVRFYAGRQRLKLSRKQVF